MATPPKEQKQKHILISGGGIAGPALALLLTRFTKSPNQHKVTIVERSPHIRPTGQQIDLAGSGQKVARFMGIEEELKRFCVHEQGLRFVGAKNETIAEFGLAETGPGVLTQELEILRGDVARVLYGRVVGEEEGEGQGPSGGGGVEWVFGDFITGMAEKGDCVTVSFDKGGERDFDLVVAADGLFSKTRDLAFGKPGKGNEAGVEIVSLNTVVALYTIPYEPSDEDWCRAYNAVGGRSCNMRPRNRKVTGAYFVVQTKDSTKIARLPVEEQMAAFDELYKHAGWETARALREMRKTEDWYVADIAQVKAKKWSKGRVVLLGDAGYCPSPLTGQGTTLAFTGAYVLAGCIATYPDFREAFEHYEEDLRPYVDKLQSLPLGAPYVALPQSAWGVWLLRNGARVVSLAFRFGVASALKRVFGVFSPWIKSSERPLPEYAGLKKECM